jgi:hypothetical protein
VGTWTTIRLEEQDQGAIAAIKQLTRITSDSDAIRLALQKVHREIKRQTPPPRSKLGRIFTRYL